MGQLTHIIKFYLTLEHVDISRYIMQKLGKEEIDWIVNHSDKKLDEYFDE